LKQVLQSLKTGRTSVMDVPCPSVKSGEILIGTTKTLISSGTERMLVEFGKAGWLDKARQQPDKVRLVIDKIKTDGLIPTIETILNKLDQPLPMGYCNVGKVLEVGSSVKGFAVGDRVVSNGKHAEVVAVPTNLCAKIPDAVSDEQASFTILGAIAIQGIRLAQPTMGESIVVVGLGPIGLLSVQLLRANGCRVLAIDSAPDRLALAKQFGAEVVDLAQNHDPVAHALKFSRERGVDAVLLTLATKSSEPLHQAALMCRKRGRIVLVGVAGLELSRADFFEKELTFQVSCSYGPGRYDRNYEENGVDYPLGFVRWTEQRNFEAVLDLMAESRLDIQPLISHQFDLSEADKAYDVITESNSAMGVLLQYPPVSAETRTQTILLHAPAAERPEIEATASPIPYISFVGSGNYATGVLIPAFKYANARLRSIGSNTGLSGTHAAKKYGFASSTTDIDTIFSDPETTAVVLTTRHDSHAAYTTQALRAGKDVFVEKPLCLTINELTDIQTAYQDTRINSARPPLLMVGFNRRFAPQIKKIKELLDTSAAPKSLVMTVNAGKIPADHWTQDLAVGGGRIIGELCHFVDLFRFLVGAPISDWHCVQMQANTPDTVCLQLKFLDGSVGSINYFANGSKAYPKEVLNVFVSDKVLHLENFRKLRGYGWSNFKSMNLWRQDKGQRACVQAFLAALDAGTHSPIPETELFEISRLMIEISQAK
jgi:threonine dehydrogenase-like Zn-dependent dehydrogenase/predicted dehydrogenase